MEIQSNYWRQSTADANWTNTLPYAPIRHSHAEICPICNGRGKVTEDFDTSGELDKRTCHGCGGKGWITVQNC